MKDGALISVIVPVYNVENYLDRCVKSILGQTYKNFELILVDDGSTDISGDMCDWYSILSSKIFVIHKENGGLSDARNAGTKMAKGEYVTYIDSDDYVSKDYLEHLVTLAEEHGADMVCSNYVETFDSDGNAFGDKEEIQYETDTFTGEAACKRMLETIETYELVVAWGKLIKTKIAKKHLFPKGRVHEDNATTYKFYLDSETVVLSKKPIYAYLIRKDGIQRRQKSKKQFDDELFSVFSRAVELEERQYIGLAELAWQIAFERLRDIVLFDTSARKEWNSYYDKLMHAITKQTFLKRKVYILMKFPFLYVMYRRLLKK